MHHTNYTLQELLHLYNLGFDNIAYAIDLRNMIFRKN